MKKNFFLIVVVLVCNWSQSQIVNIPDAIFKAELISLGVDTNLNSEIEVSEALAITTLNISNSQIASIVGIEAFTNLQNLSCTNNYSLTSINISQLINLQNINFSRCTNTSLNSIDISQLTNLQYANFSNCDYLYSLDLSANTNLIELDCSGCLYLPSINVSGLVNLQTLKCNGCFDFTNLNVSGLTNLQFLEFRDCTSLITVETLGLNNLLHLDCSYSHLDALDLTGASNLATLLCSDNDLTSLNLSPLINLTHLDCHSNELATLDLSPVVNLTHLDCKDNSITSLINLSSLINLDYLDCSRNELTLLNVEPLINLTHLDCNINFITPLNVSNLSNLIYLDCSFNEIAALNLSQLINLTRLDCSYNQLTSIDVVPLTNLTHLNCSNNLLTNLNVLPMTNLTHLFCSFNQFTTLDFSTLLNVTNLGFGNEGLNPTEIGMLTNLKRLNFMGGIQESLNLNPLINLNSLIIYSLSTSFDLSNLPPTFFDDMNNSTFGIYGLIENLNLKTGFPLVYTNIQLDNLNYICANESDIQLLTFSYPNVQVNSYCSFSPSGIYNTITGTVTFDINNNGCEATDYNPANFKMQLFDGTNTGASFTNTMGEYLFYTQAGNFGVSPQLQNPYFNVTPATTQLNFPTVDGSNQILDVCITPNGIHNDVEIAIVPITPPRPGFDVDYLLTYTNKGNQVLSGSVNYTFDDAVLDFISATPTITSQSVNNLTWTYANLSPFESRSIDIRLNLNGPTETPPVNIDDIVTCSATINPISGDETPDDNTFELEEIVVGAYDPNDKTCLEGDTITPSQVGEYLHYLIRFQNSGTAPAVNVVVKDMIDTTKFDMASLQLTSASHPHITRILNNKVEFIFENIQLPAEQDDEPGSHGFVAFKIKTKSNLVLGNSVSNTAAIYFDYNFPIITNTTSTTVSNLGVNEFENLSVSINPNPVKDILNIAADNVISSVLMYDVQGRLIATQVNNSTSTILDMSQQNVGVYFVKVQTEKGMKVEKVIKE